MTTTVFSAAGQTSPIILLKPGQTATYAVTTVFVATVVLQKSTDNQNWSTVTTVTDATLSSSLLLAPDRNTFFRWKCTAYTSDSPTVSLTEAVDVVREFVSPDGTTKALTITDAGITSPLMTITSETVASETVSTLLTVAGLLSLGAPETSLTAHAGGTQAAALALSALVSTHRVTVCATAADSVKLSAPSVVGETHIVINDGAALLQVYGSGTDTINDVATATGVSLIPGQRALFIALTTGSAAKWSMIQSALLTAGTQTIAGAKTFSSPAAISALAVGGSSVSTATTTGIFLSGLFADMRFNWTNSANTGFFDFAESGTQKAYVQYAGSTSGGAGERFTFMVNGSKPMEFGTNATARMTIAGTGGVTFTGAALSTSASGGVGYGTGAGAAVTQGTNRTTGVTINAACGAITLVSAAGTASWQSFTVTNSTVAASDVIRVVQKSGTDKNQIHVTAVGAGSFEISFATTGGTTTEQPVFNFAVIKAVAA